MLIRADTFEKLNFSALMEVYAESNAENGAYFWPEKTPARQMELAEEAFRGYLQREFYGAAHGTYWIWAENDRYLSALRLERHEEGLLMEALETRPDRRGMGYAKRLIPAVLDRLPGGTRVYSHVSGKNTPSLAAHRACGFTMGLDYSVDPDGERREDQVTMEIVVS